MEKTVVFKCPYWERCQYQERINEYHDKEVKLYRPYNNCIAPFLKIKYKKYPVCGIVLDEEGVGNWHLLIKDLTLFKQPKKNPPVKKQRKK